MSTCKQWREGDENACTCGYRWGVKDEDPHPKKTVIYDEVTADQIRKRSEHLRTVEARRRLKVRRAIEDRLEDY